MMDFKDAVYLPLVKFLSFYFIIFILAVLMSNEIIWWLHRWHWVWFDFFDALRGAIFLKEADSSYWNAFHLQVGSFLLSERKDNI